MKVKIIILWVFVLCLPEVVLALSEDDFAYRASLEISADKPFYELKIPAIVYESTSRADLGDLRVLNGAGQIVPHGLRTAPPTDKHSDEKQTVAFFPLYRPVGQAMPELHLNIRRDAAGEVIDINSHQPEQDNTERLVGYILDLREWKRPIEELKVNWSESENSSFIRKLNVSTSQDLAQWHEIGSGMTLVNLSFQDHRLVEDTLKLSVGQTKTAENYLRIMFEGEKPGLKIDSFEVKRRRYAYLQAQDTWREVKVTAGSTPGDYYFEHQLKSAVRQLRVPLPENNTVVRVTAFSRANKQQPWRHRGSTLLYRLSVDGIELHQTTMTISSSRDADWKLRVDQQGGGLGSDLTVVELAWQPQNLLFVARGQPPFRLVWGSAKVEPVMTDANQLLVGSNNTENILGQARWLSDSVVKVNLQALEPAGKPVNWRQWILWVVLIVAAVILVWMAVRLMKLTNADANTEL